MRKIKVVLILVFISLLTGNSAISSDFVSSYSFIAFSGSKNGVLTQIKIGLISTSFNDIFARVISSGIETQFRFLEAEKPVNINEIERYVENQYPDLPKQDQKQFKEILIKAKLTDEILKAKTASPSLSDEEKLIYAKERERLLEKLWEYEAEILNSYTSSFKSKKYYEIKSEVTQLDSMHEFTLDQYHTCVISKSCFKSVDELASDLTTLESRRASIIDELIKYPVELQKDKDSTVHLFLEETKDKKFDFVSYLSKLYSQHKGKF